MRNRWLPASPTNRYEPSAPSGKESEKRGTAAISCRLDEPALAIDIVNAATSWTAHTLTGRAVNSSTVVVFALANSMPSIIACSIHTTSRNPTASTGVPCLLAPCLGAICEAADCLGALASARSLSAVGNSTVSEDEGAPDVSSCGDGLNTRSSIRPPPNIACGRLLWLQSSHSQIRAD